MVDDDASSPSAVGPSANRRGMLFGGLLVVAFVVTFVMLVTDKNLQTNFGAQSPYYFHWYGALAMGVLDLLVGLAIVATSSRSFPRMESKSTRRVGVIGGLAWTTLALAATVGIVATYAQVGFPSAGEFARYLFGISAYPGALSYIPGLYDVLVVLYVLAAACGVLALRPSGSPSDPRPGRRT